MGNTGKDNRLWQMRRLVKLCGGTNLAAELVLRSPAYVTAIAGPSPQRAIGDKSAAHIERSFGLRPGELDDPPPIQFSGENSLIDQVVEILAKASEKDKELVFNIANLIVGRSLIDQARSCESKATTEESS